MEEPHLVLPRTHQQKKRIEFLFLFSCAHDFSIHHFRSEKVDYHLFFFSPWNLHTKRMLLLFIRFSILGFVERCSNFRKFSLMSHGQNNENNGSIVFLYFLLFSFVLAFNVFGGWLKTRVNVLNNLECKDEKNIVAREIKLKTTLLAWSNVEYTRFS